VVISSYDLLNISEGLKMGVTNQRWRKVKLWVL